MPEIDTGLLKEIAKQGLLDALDSVPEAKTLVLDPSLAGPLGLITDVSLLKHHGVEKMFWLETGPMSAPTRSVVYLCRPEIRWMKVVAEQIKSHRASGSTYTYNLFLVPRVTTLCTRILEEEGVLGNVTLGSYGLEFIPLEDDLLSLEREDAWRECFLDGDHTPVFYAAQALMTVQQAYGLFPRIVGKGDLAKRLCDLLLRQRKQALVSDPSNPALTAHSTTIDSCIIIDRSVDLVTPLCTQLTYQGLLDEVMGIRNSHLEVDPALLSSPQRSSSATSSSSGPPKKKKHRLDARTDTVLSDIRDRNFAVVGERLHKVAVRINQDYEGRHQAQTVQQIREFVGRLGVLQGEHQGLRLHTNLTEQIMALTNTDEFNKALEIQQNLVAGVDVSKQLTMIEELMTQEAPLNVVLRLLCLYSVVNGGLKPKDLDFIKRELLQARTYGYGHIPLLLALSRLNLLTPTTLTRSPFSSVRRPLRLINDEVDEREPTDIAYVYSGYAPLSIRLVQAVAQKEALVGSGSAGEEGPKARGDGRPMAHPIVGWRGFEDVVRGLPGATFDEVQKVEVANSKRMPQERTTTTLVFFLGGCTYTEVAALRFMSTQTKGRRFLVATTSMINGRTIFPSFEDAEKAGSQRPFG